MIRHEFILVSLEKIEDDNILIKDIIPVVDCVDVSFSTPLDAMFSIWRSMGKPVKKNQTTEYVMDSVRAFGDALILLFEDSILQFDNNATIIVSVEYECEEFSSKLTYTKDSRADSIRRIFGPITLKEAKIAHIKEGLSYG